MNLNLKYQSTDNGNCRVYFRAQNKRLYCWQSDTPQDFTLYTCSRDGEPSCPVRRDVYVITGLYIGDEAIDRELESFLLEQEMLLLEQES